MLTDASIEGKVDHLLGLKENVIIGKLIPAATGLKRYRQIDIGPSDSVPAHLYERPRRRRTARRRSRRSAATATASTSRPRPDVRGYARARRDAARTTPARRPRSPRSSRRWTRRSRSRADEVTRRGRAPALAVLPTDLRVSAPRCIAAGASATTEAARNYADHPARRGGVPRLLRACGGGAAPPCGLPDAKPLWIDYGAPVLLESSSAGRASSSPARARSIRPGGACRGREDGLLGQLPEHGIGTPSVPADPTIARRPGANASSTSPSLSAGCHDPVIAMNELFGASTPTPWTPTTARYRANVIEWAAAAGAVGESRSSSSRASPTPGATPASGGASWRSSPTSPSRSTSTRARCIAPGRSCGSRACGRRCAARLEAVRGRHPACEARRRARLPDEAGPGGREGLEPAGAWFEVAKLQALAARQVARELGLAHIWSWGWGFFNEEAKDPDKLGAACVWLWARDPVTLRPPAKPSLRRDLRSGQIDLPAGVRCALDDAASRRTRSAISPARPATRSSR